MKKQFYLIFLLFLIANIAWGQEEASKMIVLPQGGAVMKITSSGESEFFAYNGKHVLTDKALQAIDEVPQWLQDDLSISLLNLYKTPQETWADSIINADELYKDEIGFLVAHLPQEILDSLDPWILEENAQLIYEMDEQLDYVSITEKESETDNWKTTLTYTLKNSEGQLTEWELPWEYYYWNVLSPMMDAEWPGSYDPTLADEEEDPPDGFFWRTYYLNNFSQDSDRSFRPPYVLKSPNNITDEYLSSIIWPDQGASTSIFYDLEVAGITLLKTQDGSPAAVKFVKGNGCCCNATCPSPDGEFIATMIPIEKIAADGSPELLQNFVLSGTANYKLRNKIIIDYSTSPVTEEGKILIVRDQMPFDLETDPVETILQDADFEYDVVTSQQLAGLVLTSTEAPFHVIDYIKIIFESDQPRSFYDNIVLLNDGLELYVDYGGIIEFHGSTDAENDWAGLRMPGGIYILPQNEENKVTSLQVEGFPSLTEVINGVNFVWDGIEYPQLSGTRPLNKDEGAFGVIGWWVERNLPLNVAEENAWFNRSSERSLQPVRLLYYHYGNCGELQDAIASASRSLLLPIQNISIMADDHVWNEFYMMDQWHPYQVSWSAYATHIDNWTIAYDGDTAGDPTARTVSGVIGWKLNGDVDNNILGRYETEVIDEDGHITGDYTKHTTLHFTVTDDEDNRVDGALIMIFSEYIYDANQLSFASWGYSDINGEATITFGENNNVYIAVTKDSVGSYPSQDGDTTSVKKVVSASEMIAGETVEVEVQLDGHYEPVYQEEQLPVPSETEARLGIDLEITDIYNFMQVPNAVEDWTVIKDSSTKALFDVYALNEENYQKWINGETEVVVYPVEKGANENIIKRVELPQGDWYIVVTNQSLTSTGAIYEITGQAELIQGEDVSLQDGGTDIQQDIENDTNDTKTDADVGEYESKGGGCSCSVAQNNSDVSKNPIVFIILILGSLIFTKFRG